MGYIESIHSSVATRAPGGDVSDTADRAPGGDDGDGDGDGDPYASVTAWASAGWCRRARGCFLGYSIGWRCGRKAAGTERRLEDHDHNLPNVVHHHVDAQRAGARDAHQHVVLCVVVLRAHFEVRVELLGAGVLDGLGQPASAACPSVRRQIVMPTAASVAQSGRLVATLGGILGILAGGLGTAQGQRRSHTQGTLRSCSSRRAPQLWC